jgi:hypothetical protein
MHALTIHHSLPHCGGADVAIASDRHQRSFMAVAAERGHAHSLLFVEIDRITRLELERGEVGHHTVMAERAAGEVFESADFVRENAAAAS